MAWTDDPLTAGNMFLNKIHLTELHAALWQKYTDAGLTSDTFAVWKLTAFPVFYVDESSYKPYWRNNWIEEIRDKINYGSLLTVCGFANIAALLNAAIGQADWTDPVLYAGRTFIRNDHITELREAIDLLIPAGHIETFSPAIVGDYSSGGIIKGNTWWGASSYNPTEDKCSIGIAGGNKHCRLQYDGSGSTQRYFSQGILLKYTDPAFPNPDIFYNYVLTSHSKLRLKINGSMTLIIKQTSSPLYLDNGVSVALGTIESGYKYIQPIHFSFTPVVPGTYVYPLAGTYEIDLSTLAGQHVQYIQIGISLDVTGGYLDYGSNSDFTIDDIEIVEV